MDLGNLCIFCKTGENPFSSKEHIVPMGAGNNELILPPGYVCDKCNNTVLSRLDNFLLNFGPIKLMRGLYRIPNREGRVLPVKFGNLQVHPTKTGIQVNVPNLSTKHFAEGEIQPDGTTNFKITFLDGKMTPKKLKLLARSLYKIGLEILCLDHPKDFVLDSRFDEVRRIVLAEVDFHGYIILSTNPPSTKSNMRYRFLKFPDGGEATFFDLDFYGAVFLFDFERRQIEDAELIKKAGFTVLEW